jgi:two-component system, cell cycle response regulator
MKILIADDDPISRRLMQRELEKEGYEVVVAENGSAALEILLGSDGPRLALVDWTMPELDGPGLCREIRSSRHRGFYIYIVLLTSRQESDDVVAGLEAGADDYTTKPFRPAELRARLRTGRRILALEETLVHAREEMRYKATHDTLTTLWNRGSILSLVCAELQRSVREATLTALLLCDLDHFKQVNDIHGHLVGDAVLEEVARRLIAAVRSYDAVGRYGGEEFLILLSRCDESGLRARAEDIRAAIGSTPIRTADMDLPVTISVGAVICDNSKGDLSLQHALAQADAALYRAKAAGRNRASFARSLTTA